MAKSETGSEMPLLLALETATEVSSVALFRGDELLGSVEYVEGRNHAKLITVMIQSLLEDLEYPRSEIAAISVAKGPGSYTGLRVGVSTAKGLCMALGAPLLSVGSLEALAWQVRDLARRLDAWICPMIDARRMEVYCRMYDPELVPQNDTEAKVIDADAFAEVLSARKLIFVGNGALKCRELLEASPNAIVLPEILSTARSMGSVSFQKFVHSDFEDLVTFEPFYLKNFVATKSKKKLL